MSRKGSNEVGEGVVELVFVGVNVAVGGCIAGDHLQTDMVVLEGGREQALEMGRQEIRAREADGSSVQVQRPPFACCHCGRSTT